MRFDRKHIYFIATFELRLPVVQLIWRHKHDLPVADMVTVALELELLRAMRDQTEVKIQMVMPLESKFLVFRLYQTQVVMFGCVILDLFHSIKKLGHIMTKLIRQFLTCLVKNDHCACMALRDLRLLRRPSKLNITKAPQIKAKVMALSLVNGSP